MSPFSVSDLVADWHPPLLITIGCVLSVAVYLNGFLRLRKTRPDFPAWRASALLRRSDMLEA